MAEARVALIGYGLGGESFHAPFIDVTAGLRLAAVVTGNPERAARARSRYPGVEVLPDAASLWSRAAEFDLAVITTPNRHHAEQARAALEHGMAAVVDKPFAASSAEARQLAELAGRRGLLLSPFHNRRYDGDFRTVRRLLAEGDALGAVHRFESRFERWRPELKAGWKESTDPADASGIVFDLGSHLIDQALVLFGRPRRVYAEISARRAGSQVPDDAFLALQHEGGVHSHLWLSALAADRGPRFRVLGDAGAYVKHGMDPQEDALRTGAVPGGPGWGEEPESAWGRLGAGEEFRPVRTEPGGYQDYYAGIAAALTDGGQPPVTADDAVTGLEVIEAAYRSSQTHTVVELP
ncbi:Gfo/Idh/MocA family oxidoreductase [Goodfellowiella coeruleoviolacea]|uniref:Dehydrogenase n=1 Tax=Goodfellowiella coeruleoviolacea TaxID=334858 RepID=A0AAE3GIK4_9PSEU|nr:Gfo/Idh/MocA family oxidoreductase [Goodfellowiella coeruleoviolacea]MCP2168072.1 putative dehydrogenase [Goodfellowiella coeruleoviolacea]